MRHCFLRDEHLFWHDESQTALYKAACFLQCRQTHAEGRAKDMMQSCQARMCLWITHHWTKYPIFFVSWTVVHEIERKYFTWKRCCHMGIKSFVSLLVSLLSLRAKALWLSPKPVFWGFWHLHKMPQNVSPSQAVLFWSDAAIVLSPNCWQRRKFHDFAENHQRTSFFKFVKISPTRCVCPWLQWCCCLPTGIRWSVAAKIGFPGRTPVILHAWPGKFPECCVRFILMQVHCCLMQSWKKLECHKASYKTGCMSFIFSEDMFCPRKTFFCVISIWCLCRWCEETGSKSDSFCSSEHVPPGLSFQGDWPSSVFSYSFVLGVEFTSVWRTSSWNSQDPPVLLMILSCKSCYPGV